MRFLSNIQEWIQAFYEKRERQFSEIRKKEELQGDNQGATKLQKRESRRIQVEFFQEKEESQVAVDTSGPSDCGVEYLKHYNQPWVGTQVGRVEDRGEDEEVAEVAEAPEADQGQRRLLRKIYSMWEQ